MVIRNYSAHVSGNRAFTIEEFKFLLQELDSNGDCQTSKRVLADAVLPISGEQFVNRDLVDENEINSPVNSALKHQDYKIIGR
uniref:Uncharacterized protein n=1 Tax=Salix viminalis TaxID=40686 RepID=A0A6N2MWY9_SALVM